MSIHLYNKVKDFMFAMISSREDKQRLTVFLLAMITGLLGFLLHIFGIWGSSDHTLLLLSIGNWFGLFIVLILYLCRKLELFTSFVLYGIVMQAILSAKIIYISYTNPPGASYLILFNSFISLLVIIVLVMGYMRALPFFITIASMLTSVAVRVIRPELLQLQFVLFFVFIELFCCALGLSAWRDLHFVEKENSDFRDEEYRILKALHMTKDELTAYLAMSLSDEHDYKYISNIFDCLDERSEHNIIKAVKEHETEKRMRNLDLSELFPMLSSTEIEVCRLVIEGKTLSQIANLLNKNTNNVSSVRIHIRKKLGLTSDQDLREYLLSKLRDQ